MFRRPEICPVCTQPVKTAGRRRLRLYEPHLSLNAEGGESLCPISSRLLIEICDMLVRREFASRAKLTPVLERVETEAYEDGVEAGVADDGSIFTAFTGETTPKLLEWPAGARVRKKRFDSFD